MGKKSAKTMSVSDANKYKTLAEARAVLVTAWMPLIRLVTGFTIVSLFFLAAGPLGIIDTSHIKLFIKAYTAITKP